jgi:Zn-dependent protease
MEISLIFSIAVLIISIVIHEVSHGYTAYFLGDPTAKYAGRLTVNPLPHIDMLGSLIIPFILSLIPGGIIFGWAKPVPVNTYNLKGGRWGEAIVAFAGPASNIVIALLASFVLRFGFGLAEASLNLLASIVLVNIVLFVFNMMPVTPLDGSKVLGALLPVRFLKIRRLLESHSFVYVIVFIFFVWPFIEPLIPWLFRLMTGFSLGV